MGNLNKPSGNTQGLLVYHIFYIDPKTNTNKGINVWGTTINQIVEIFTAEFPHADIIYLMNKTQSL